jgi:hypothetical protein
VPFIYQRNGGNSSGLLTQIAYITSCQKQQQQTQARYSLSVLNCEGLSVNSHRSSRSKLYQSESNSLSLEHILSLNTTSALLDAMERQETARKNDSVVDSDAPDSHLPVEAPVDPLRSTLQILANSQNLTTNSYLSASSAWPPRALAASPTASVIQLLNSNNSFSSNSFPLLRNSSNSNINNYAIEAFLRAQQQRLNSSYLDYSSAASLQSTVAPVSTAASLSSWPTTIQNLNISNNMPLPLQLSSLRQAQLSTPLAPFRVNPPRERQQPLPSAISYDSMRAIDASFVESVADAWRLQQQQLLLQQIPSATQTQGNPPLNASLSTSSFASMPANDNDAAALTNIASLEHSERKRPAEKRTRPSGTSSNTRTRNKEVPISRKRNAETSVAVATAEDTEHSESDVPAARFSTTDGPSDQGKRAPRGSKISECFAQKLYRMLMESEEKELHHIVTFVPSGDAFKVHNRTAFVEKIACHYFRIMKFSSFKRQLYLYHFERQKSGPDEGAYFHPYFKRGRPDLLHLVQRVPIMPSSSSLEIATEESEQEAM